MMSTAGETISARLNQRLLVGAATLIATFGAAGPTSAADKTDLAISTLELGGSVGKLVWTEATAPEPSGLPADRYLDLANEVKNQIERGRTTSNLVRANFDVVGTALLYGAAVDPEPLSKAVAGLAAWGAKKTGDAFGEMIIEDTQSRARGILARGLQESGFSQDELRRMTPEELRTKVDQLKVGGQEIATILASDPKSLDLLRASAVDIASDIGVEAIARSSANQGSIENIRQQLSTATKSIDDYRAYTERRLDKISTGLEAIQEQAAITQRKLGDLQNQVTGNTTAIRSLAEISYGGWTTSQKLQAVQSGLLPGLDDNQRAALIISLEEQKKQENSVAKLRSISADLSNLTTIASNLGLPSDAVRGLQTAQTVATGLAQYAAGDYLGAAASATSLIGMGKPDAAAARHAAMMKYLQEQFAVVNQKLDRIIDLQVNTIQLIEALAAQEERYHRAVLSQLDRVEEEVLGSHQISQAILLSEWQNCQGLVNGTALNGQYAINNRSILLEVVKGRSSGIYAGGCHTQMTGFLDAWVKSANWSGQIIAAANFPDEVISSDAPLLQQMLLFRKKKEHAYAASRDLVLAYLSKHPEMGPAKFAARVQQPVYSARYQKHLRLSLEDRNTSIALNNFTCSQDSVIDIAARDLLCFGYPDGSPKQPSRERLSTLMRAALIGPQAKGILDTGIVLGQLSGLAVADLSGAFVFVPEQEILQIAQTGFSPSLAAAVNQQKGPRLLRKLKWLSTAMLLQQSVTYGDFTAEIAEAALYNPVNRRLEPEGVDSDLAPYAMAAMRANPTLARNVVLLAARHAIADGLGGDAPAEDGLYQRTFFGIGVQNFSGPAACAKEPQATAALSSLLPNWVFEFRVSAVSKSKDSRLVACPLEDIDASGHPHQYAPRGSGAAVVVGDVYILLPSSLALTEGVFEAPDSLREALRYHDRVNQAQIDARVRTH